MPPTGNEQRFGDGKMKKTDLLRDPIQPAHEIGKDATKTCVIAVQLLVFVGGNEQRLCRRGKVRNGVQILTSARRCRDSHGREFLKCIEEAENRNVTFV